MDVHFVISGSECIDLTDVTLTALTENRYDSEDAALYSAESSYSTLELHEGDFLIVFPGEAHRPGITANGEAGKILKAVAKVRAECFEAKRLLLI